MLDDVCACFAICRVEHAQVLKHLCQAGLSMSCGYESSACRWAAIYVQQGKVMAVWLQEPHLHDQLHGLQSKLQALQGEDKEAVEEESASCTQLITMLYQPNSKQANRSVPLPASTATPVQSSSNVHAPDAQRHLHEQQAGQLTYTQSPAAGPLLLGPPS